MKRRAFLKNGLWLLGAPSILRAQSFSNAGFIGGVGTASLASGGGGGGSYLLQENFDDVSVGWDSNNANAWSNSGANNPKYAVAPAPLDGITYSLYNPVGEYCYCDISASGEVYGYLVFQMPTISGSAASAFAEFRNGATRLVAVSISHGESNRIYIQYSPPAGALAETTNGISAAATYRLWWHFKKSASAAVIDVEWQDTSTSRQGSGNNFASRSDGTVNTDVTRLLINNDGLGGARIVDTIRLSTTGYYVP